MYSREKETNGPQVLAMTFVSEASVQFDTQ